MSPIEKIIWWILIAMMILHGIQIAEAGTNFQRISDTMEIWTFANGVLVRVKESNQKGMSKDRIREILEQVRAVLERNQRILEAEKGAMIFTSCTIVESQ